MWDKPEGYLINTTSLLGYSPDEVQANFANWIDNDPNKITQEVVNMYRHMNGESAVQKVINAIEEGRFNLFKSNSFLMELNVTGVHLEKDTIRFKLPNTAVLNSIASADTINVNEYYRNYFNFWNKVWNKLNYNCKYVIIDFESKGSYTTFIDRIKEDIEDICPIIEVMIENNGFWNFIKLFSSVLNTDIIPDDLLMKIVKIYRENIESVENREDDSKIEIITKYTKDIKIIQDVLDNRKISNNLL